MSSHACSLRQQLVAHNLLTVLAILLCHFFTIGFEHSLFFANAPRHHIFPPYTTIEESLLNSFLFKVGAAKITAMPSAKGKFWELRIMATKPPDVTLVDMVMAKEMKPKEGPIDRK
jgi:hypothetical protein